MNCSASPTHEVYEVQGATATELLCRPLQAASFTQEHTELANEKGKTNTTQLTHVASFPRLPRMPKH